MPEIIDASKQEPVIKLEGVSVRYHLPEEYIGSFKEYAIRAIQGKIKYRSFWALSDLHIHVNRGDTLGIIGRNGAGKSTLLKVISRVLIPTQGRVWISGGVSPLLELGAGFHPELTGRENIFLNGTLLGHTHRDIDEHLKEVIEFAELSDFIDAPLRTYSSGMVARLGFSVVTTWKPEILILDEVLSVGDKEFRLKCRKRMETYRSKNVTALLVTHDMNTIEELCSQVLWLDHGVIRMVGTPKEVIRAYKES